MVRWGCDGVEEAETGADDESGDRDGCEEYFIGYDADQLIFDREALAIIVRPAVPDGIEGKFILNVDFGGPGIGANIGVLAASHTHHKRKSDSPGVTLVHKLLVRFARDGVHSMCRDIELDRRRNVPIAGYAKCSKVIWQINSGQNNDRQATCHQAKASAR